MKRDYNNPAYKRWRKSVYQRDHFTCQWPYCTSKQKLNAHHILTWAQNPGLRYDIKNGITLCATHHKMINGLESIYASIFLKILHDKKNNE